MKFDDETGWGDCELSVPYCWGRDCVWALIAE